MLGDGATGFDWGALTQGLTAAAGVAKTVVGMTQGSQAPATGGASPKKQAELARQTKMANLAYKKTWLDYALLGTVIAVISLVGYNVMKKAIK